MKKRLTQTALLTAMTLGVGFSISNVQAEEVINNSEETVDEVTIEASSSEVSDLETKIEEQTKVVKDINSEIASITNNTEANDLSQNAVDNAKKIAETAAESVTKTNSEITQKQEEISKLEEDLKKLPKTIETVENAQQQSTDWEYYFNLLKNGTQSGVSADEYLEKVFMGRETEAYKTINDNAEKYNLPVKWGGESGLSGSAGALKKALDAGIDNLPQETITYSSDNTNIKPITEIDLSNLGTTMTDFQSGTYKYVPNPDKVSKYYVYYLNELRRLNGINAPIKSDTRVTKLVQDNVNFFIDLQNRNVPGYTSVYSDTKVSELYDNNGVRIGSRPVNAVTPENGLLYLTRGESSMLSKSNHAFVYSDQELAYQILLSEFSEYRNDVRYKETGVVQNEKGYPAGSQKDALWRNRETNYHRLVALFADTDFAGVGVAYDKEGNLRTNTIYMSENTEDFKLFEQESHYNWPGNPDATPHIPTGTDARLPGNGTSQISIDPATGNMVYNGNRVVFLPKTVFNYVESITQTVDNPEYTKFKKEISDKKKELEELNNELVSLVATSNKAEAEYKSLETAFETYNDLLTKLKEANDELISLKNKLSEVKPITSNGTQTPPTITLPEAKIVLKEVSFETDYENDPTLELGKEEVVREGQNGSVQVITIGDQVTEIVLTEKVDKLVKRGTLVK
ncbi:TPA: G5 domain-containing protein, partial [Streptococcus suis]